MKIQRLVNPETVTVAALFLYVLMAGVYCSASEQYGETGSAMSRKTLELRGWTVSYTADPAKPWSASLSMASTVEADGIAESDTLHMETDLPDSVRYKRRWFIGAGDVILFSITAPINPLSGQREEAMRILDEAYLTPPAGLRSAELSNRTPGDIDSERASAPVEPPPQVHHYITVTYDPTNEENCLVLLDSMVVDFRMSSYDSLAFSFVDENSVILSDAGRFVQTEAANRYVCHADTARMYTGVFQTVFAMNRVYSGPGSQTAGQARMRSAFLSGIEAFPVSRTPEHYRITFRVPDDKSIWTPLIQENDSTWRSPPGGIRGGPPIAIGNYTSVELSGGYQLLLLSSDTVDSLDIAAAEMLAETIHGILHFPSARYAFVQVSNPDRPILIPGFGGLLFTTGSLAPAADVSSWPDAVKNGRSPEGTLVVTQATEAILRQSLQLDPIIHDMLMAWIPLCYYRDHSEDQAGIAALREAYLKHYLYGTEAFFRGGSVSTHSEHALADPALRSSPLRPLVARSKGALVMEYLYQQGHLASLPQLLQNFTHASSANYWPKVTSSLNLQEQKDNELLKRLFYLPGIPQIRVNWWQEDERIVLEAREIQQGVPFDLKLENCLIHLPDTTVTRIAIRLVEPGRYRCIMSRDEVGNATAIDLNSQWILPADFMYTRLDEGTGP